MGGLYNLQTFFGVYNFIVNTSKQVLFLPPSDAYVRSFLYLLYTLIKLYYTKALSDQASSLAPDWILLLQGPRIPVSLCDSTTTFQEQETKLLIFVGSWRKQGNSTKTSTSASWTTLKPLTVWIRTNCGKFLKRWEYQSTLPASWEATVRTGHGTMDWFNIEKGVCQGCILSYCLFNFHA